jgi:hypothetical protein
MTEVDDLYGQIVMLSGYEILQLVLRLAAYLELVGYPDDQEL